MYSIENMGGTYDSRAMVVRSAFCRLQRPSHGEFHGQRNYESKLSYESTRHAPIKCKESQICGCGPGLHRASGSASRLQACARKLGASGPDFRRRNETSETR